AWWRDSQSASSRRRQKAFHPFISPPSWSPAPIISSSSLSRFLLQDKKGPRQPRFLPDFASSPTTRRSVFLHHPCISKTPLFVCKAGKHLYFFDTFLDASSCSSLPFTDGLSKQFASSRLKPA